MGTVSHLKTEELKDRESAERILSEVQAEMAAGKLQSVLVCVVAPDGNFGFNVSRGMTLAGYAHCIAMLQADLMALHMERNKR